MKTVIATIGKEITVERIKDLLCSAFEGGTSYWAVVIETPEKHLFGAEYYHEIPAMGGELNIYDREDYNIDDTKTLLGVINEERIKKAFELMAEGKNEDGSDAEYLKRHLNNFLNDNEDAETGDVFVQMAVMGKVDFG